MRTFWYVGNAKIYEIPTSLIITNFDLITTRSQNTKKLQIFVKKMCIGSIGMYL